MHFAMKLTRCAFLKLLLCKHFDRVRNCTHSLLCQLSSVEILNWICLFNCALSGEPAPLKILLTETYIEEWANRKDCAWLNFLCCGLWYSKQHLTTFGVSHYMSLVLNENRQMQRLWIWNVQALWLFRNSVGILLCI